VLAWLVSRFWASNTPHSSRVERVMRDVFLSRVSVDCLDSLDSLLDAICIDRVSALPPVCLVTLLIGLCGL